MRVCSYVLIRLPACQARRDSEGIKNFGEMRRAVRFSRIRDGRSIATLARRAIGNCLCFTSRRPPKFQRSIVDVTSFTIIRIIVVAPKPHACNDIREYR
jgi:hypothetical protein